MPNNSPQAAKFSNEQVRPVADRLSQAYFAILELEDIWINQGLNTEITNTDDEIMDGASADGRTVIDGIDVHSFVNQALAFKAFYEDGAAPVAPGRQGVLQKPAVNLTS